MTAAEWRTAARRRNAWHEVGHALLSFVLTGAAPELLSLRPGKAYSATALLADRPGWDGDLNIHLSSIEQPESLRRYLETAIVVFLAGDLAAGLAGYLPTGYAAASDDEQAAQTAAEALAALSPRRRELLAQAEAKPTSTSDLDLAWRASWGLSGNPDEANAHLAWLRIVARHLLLLHIDALGHLADALIGPGVMDADAFLSIVHATSCACHSWPNPPTVNGDTPVMPSLLSRKPKPDPEQIYVTVAGFVLDAPPELTMFAPHIGSRLKGSHPAVQHLFANGGEGFLVPDGSDYITIAAARARLEDRIAYPPDPVVAAVPMVRAVEAFQVQDGFARLPGSGYADESGAVYRTADQIQPVVRQIAVGDLLPADSEIVKKHKSSFEKVSES